MVEHGRTWSNVRTWSTMFDHGRTWSNMVNMVEHNNNNKPCLDYPGPLLQVTVLRFIGEVSTFHSETLAELICRRLAVPALHNRTVLFRLRCKRGLAFQRHEEHRSRTQ